MRVKFIRTLSTPGQAFLRGTTYDLDPGAAVQFVCEGHAEHEAADPGRVAFVRQQIVEFDNLIDLAGANAQVGPHLRSRRDEFAAELATLTAAGPALPAGPSSQLGTIAPLAEAGAVPLQSPPLPTATRPIATTPDGPELAPASHPAAGDPTPGQTGTTGTPQAAPAPSQIGAPATAPVLTLTGGATVANPAPVVKPAAVAKAAPKAK